MKIAVSAAGNSLESNIEPRFGRCPYFLIIDTDTFEFEAVQNTNASLGGGAGIQSAQLVSEKGARYLLTGNCGPNAYQTLSAANIGIITGCSGSIRKVVEQFKASRLSTSSAPNVSSHFGSGAGFADPANPSSGLNTGFGGGRGMGRGGGGGGRGMGRGMGMGSGGNARMPSDSDEDPRK